MDVRPTETASGATVVAAGLGLSTPGKQLLEDAAFAIRPGRKVALVGRNGGGKSTLLAVIEALAEGSGLPEHVSTQGTLSIAGGTRVVVLPQSPQLVFRGSVVTYLDACARQVGAAWSDYQRLTRLLEAGGADDALIGAYGEALEAMERLGAWDYEARRSEVLSGLGVPAKEFADREVATLSGGEATRVALAGVLLAPSDLLLLDEPSNNLDLAGVRFLASWIRKATFSLLLVSHDRDLLDATVDEILEVEERTGHLVLFGGNYSFYAERKRELFQAQLRRYLDQERRRGKLEAAARQLAQRAEGFQARSQDDFYRGKAARVARGAKAQETRLERELNAVGEPLPPAQPRLTVLAPRLTSGRLLTARGLRLGYGGRVLLEDASIDLQAGRRLALGGANGTGKSTLLRVLAGDGPALAGSVTRTPGLRLGYLGQVPEVRDPNESLLRFASRAVSLPDDELRQLLGKVLFDDAARVRVKEASLGELRRVSCAAIFAAQPDLLLLDEPTNHLDLPSIEMLEEALDQYRGAVVAVSHDGRFLRRLGPGLSLEIASGRLLAR
jgi:ATPase subunit of ABC transporter with duplicated ATPase domains